MKIAHTFGYALFLSTHASSGSYQKVRNLLKIKNFLYILVYQCHAYI